LGEVCAAASETCVELFVCQKTQLRGHRIVTLAACFFVFLFLSVCSFFFNDLDREVADFPKKKYGRKLDPYTSTRGVGTKFYAEKWSKEIGLCKTTRGSELITEFLCVVDKVFFSVLRCNLFWELVGNRIYAMKHFCLCSLLGFWRFQYGTSSFFFKQKEELRKLEPYTVHMYVECLGTNFTPQEKVEHRKRGLWKPH